MSREGDLMDLMDLVAGRTRILSTGFWKESDVSVETSEAYLPPISDVMKAAATARFLTRKETNVSLFVGEARHLSLRHSTIIGDALSLCFGPITYPLWDICRDTFLEAFVWNIEDMPRGVGNAAVVLTCDDKIVIHKRSEHVDFSYKLALIGGVFDVDSLFRHIRTEIHEELGVKDECIKDLSLLSISERLEDRRGYEFSFFAKLSVSSDELAAMQGEVLDTDGKLFF